MMESFLFPHLAKSGLISSAERPYCQITPLARGANDVFLISCHQKQYVIKIPTTAELSLIDRKNEQHAGQLTAAEGINLPYSYFDLESGVNIVPHLTGSRVLTPALMKDEPTWQAVAEWLKKLHRLSQKFQRDIRIFNVIASYRQRAAHLLPAKLADLPDWDSALNELQIELSAMQIPWAPCHNDPILTNFLITSERIYLIDWEYAGNHDPCWDLATVVADAELTAPQEQYFLDYYFEGMASPHDRRRFQIYKVLSEYLWTLWCVIMKAHDNAILHWCRFKVNLKDKKL